MSLVFWLRPIGEYSGRRFADAPAAILKHGLGHEQIKRTSHRRKDAIICRLSKGLQALKNEIKKDKEAKPIMVLISDGRANLALVLNENVKKELMEISEETRLAGVHTIVIDTETAGSSFLDMKLGYCKDIAEGHRVADIILYPT